jgi:2-iminobutanoate/2-iminopropanoate deaminase
MASRQFYSPDTVAAPLGNGYSHAVSAGGVIYTSGQIGVKPSGEIADGFEAQARCAFENLKAVLAAAHARLDDIVKVTLMLVELDDLLAYRAVREEYLPHRPASSLVVVQSLAMPELLFEVEAIAVAALPLG